MTTTYTPELHNRLRELHQNAGDTSYRYTEDGELITEWGDSGIVEFVDLDSYPATCDDLGDHERFFLASANALPALLDEIERLTEEMKKSQSKAWQEGYADGYHDHINVSMIEAGHRKPTTNPYQENN